MGSGQDQVRLKMMTQKVRLRLATWKIRDKILADQ